VCGRLERVFSVQARALFSIIKTMLKGANCSHELHPARHTVILTINQSINQNKNVLKKNIDPKDTKIYYVDSGVKALKS
jgi:hypothetical protein